MKQPKKISGLLIVLLAFTIVLTSNSCKKDDDDNSGGGTTDPSLQFVNKYQFILATFNAAPQPIIIDTVSVQFNVGDDASLFVAGALFNDSPCTDPANTAIEMRATKALFYICIGETNEASLGTWEYTNGTLIMNITVQSTGMVFPVLITDPVIANNKLSGNIKDLPLPIDANYPVGAAIPGVGLNFQLGNVYVEFAII